MSKIFIQLKQQINEKLKKRYALLATNMEEADKIQAEILQTIKDEFLILHCDYIIETITHFGWAPQVIYDDNGHFAVTNSGISPVSEDLIDGHFTAYVEKHQWADSIREALEKYLAR